MGASEAGLVRVEDPTKVGVLEVDGERRDSSKLDSGRCGGVGGSIILYFLSDFSSSQSSNLGRSISLLVTMVLATQT